MNTGLHSNIIISLAAIIFTITGGSAWAEASPDIWPVIKEGFFPKRNIEEADFITLSGPKRAESGAQVPITLTIDRPQSAADAIKSVYIIVDANPIQLAATYHLSELLGKLTLSTRIRLETDSFIHAVGETADGKLFTTAIPIRASGGCGGAVDGDDQAVLAAAGKIKLNVETPVTFNQATTTTFIIKHPMFTGLQRDLVSQGFRPAFYIQKATFTYDGKPVLDVDFGVGTSEDPYLRFDFVPPAPGKLEVKAHDNEEGKFAHTLAVE
ncbi:quinoprotein dehydrogenase-associated SoxYZ-like carrier [Methylobacillus gramineus]|uniref:quinoprotein dehydrogenase-associated SoxYZ-like carrier n=1 Tax=Methylobacillus gramineus TaxID=755169 RepID=UPI001CFFB0D3|nr:quinoprotein dehydrogenase-associated SoxYZ-like carrier [Methylobacillus gramineus]MCB5186172.1 quinoprotein dehydrogenase-associated SoxYZ-like carrier [Methylobacillus gramineus]